MRHPVPSLIACIFQPRCEGPSTGGSGNCVQGPTNPLSVHKPGSTGPGHAQGIRRERTITTTTTTLIHHGTWLLSPGTRLLSPGTWLLSPGTWLLSSGTGLLSPETWLLGSLPAAAGGEPDFLNNSFQGWPPHRNVSTCSVYCSAFS